MSLFFKPDTFYFPTPLGLFQENLTSGGLSQILTQDLWQV